MSFLHRISGPPTIDRLKARGDVRRLLAALRNEADPVIGEAALRALIEMGHTQDAVDILRETMPAWAVEPLIALLSHADTHARQGAVEALIEIGSPAVGPLIVALGEEKDEWARRAVARALGQIGDARAKEPLMAARRYGERDLRRAAAQALEQLDWQARRGGTGAEAGAEFRRHLREQALHHQGKRAAFALQKLAFTAGLLGVAAVCIPSWPDSRWLLYALPVIGLAYDVHICVQDYQVNRVREFLRTHAASVSACETDWQAYVSSRRERLTVEGSLAVTILAALTCLLDESASVLIRFGWVGLIVGTTIALYLMYRTWLRNRL